uniref:AAA+ ATPase domain-containing protein n=1 Tax=Arion vulgaris TaxID=1028688 RepID=A0A0B6ZKM7_9EUPU
MMNCLQEQITSWVQGKEAAVVNICVILKNLRQHRIKLPFAGNQKLNQYCKNVLLNRVVSKDSAINLLDSKLARTYGICHILLKNYEPAFDNDTEYVIITQKTSIQIESVQSEDFYSLKLNLIPISLGGFGHEVEQLSLLLNYSKSHISSSLRPVGVLLHGPPGCGKTSLAKYLAYTCDAVFIQIEGSNILHSDFGVGAASLTNYFRRAAALTKEGSVVLFIDEIDTLCPVNEHASLGNKQLTSALVTEMENLHNNKVSGLLVIGATNYISNVSPALRRPGRFDQEILISVPTKQQRLHILEVHTADVVLASDVSLLDVATWTVGFVGADLQALCEEVASHAHSSHLFQNSEIPVVHMVHFVDALHTIRPSLKKGLDCVVELQPVKWEEIGGLEDIKTEIKQSIEWPLLYPDALKRLDLNPTKGVLLYGPPGCCKTTLVRAAATSCNVTFLTLSGAQVYSPYVGESEKIISEAFQKARALSPAILFFDEIESLVGSRSAGSNQARVQERILSTMLNEMDGVGIRLDRKMDAAHARQSEDDQNMMTTETTPKSKSAYKTEGVSNVDKSHIIVIGATNRPDMLDSAILRPGRMDKLIFVPPPDLMSRQAILKYRYPKWLHQI